MVALFILLVCAPTHASPTLPSYYAAIAPIPRVSTRWQRPPPRSRNAQRLLALLDEIRRTTVEHRYAHQTRVDMRRGIYVWDCSAMLGWLLGRAAHMRVDRRPLARDFATRIETRRGFTRVDNIWNVEPGDVFAWRRPPGFPSNNTGHCGVFVARAERIPGRPNFALVRIVDATSLPHEDDSRRIDDGGGFGEGTMLFALDADMHAIAYGWIGSASTVVIRTPIALGRLR